MIEQGRYGIEPKSIMYTKMNWFLKGEQDERELSVKAEK